jgi:hypothetical protein
LIEITKTQSYDKIEADDIKKINKHLDSINERLGNYRSPEAIEEFITILREKIFQDIELNISLDGNFNLDQILNKNLEEYNRIISGKDEENEVLFTLKIPQIFSREKNTNPTKRDKEPVNAEIYNQNSSLRNGNYKTNSNEYGNNSESAESNILPTNNKEFSSYQADNQKIKSDNNITNDNHKLKNERKEVQNINLNHQEYYNFEISKSRSKYLFPLLAMFVLFLFTTEGHIIGVLIFTYLFFIIISLITIFFIPKPSTRLITAFIGFLSINITFIYLIGFLEGAYYLYDHSNIILFWPAYFLVISTLFWKINQNNLLVDINIDNPYIRLTVKLVLTLMAAICVTFALGVLNLPIVYALEDNIWLFLTLLGLIGFINIKKPFYGKFDDKILQHEGLLAPQEMDKEALNYFEEDIFVDNTQFSPYSEKIILKVNISEAKQFLKFRNSGKIVIPLIISSFFFVTLGIAYYWNSELYFLLSLFSMAILGTIYITKLFKWKMKGIARKIIPYLLIKEGIISRKQFVKPPPGISPEAYINCIGDLILNNIISIKNTNGVDRNDL